MTKSLPAAQTEWVISPTAGINTVEAFTGPNVKPAHVNGKTYTATTTDGREFEVELTPYPVVWKIEGLSAAGNFVPRNITGVQDQHGGWTFTLPGDGVYNCREFALDANYNASSYRYFLVKNGEVFRLTKQQLQRYFGGEELVVEDRVAPLTLREELVEPTLFDDFDF